MERVIKSNFKLPLENIIQYLWRKSFVFNVLHPCTHIQSEKKYCEKMCILINLLEKNFTCIFESFRWVMTHYWQIIWCYCFLLLNCSRNSKKNHTLSYQEEVRSQKVRYLQSAPRFKKYCNSIKFYGFEFNTFYAWFLLLHCTVF